MISEFQASTDAGAMVLSLKAGGTGLNLTAASHVVLYDRWWNPAVEDQARDRVWRIGQKSTVVCHRLVCPGTVDERVEEVVAGKRQIADMVLPKSSSVGDLDAEQLQRALGIDPDTVLAELDSDLVSQESPLLTAEEEAEANAGAAPDDASSTPPGSGGFAAVGDRESLDDANGSGVDRSDGSGQPDQPIDSERTEVNA
jgi:hypothetical protein